ncbi:hypothetical protein RE6C_04737 [Rhodopirellula europaea 6C]|uniref:Uncharacterized protein n=1 Tax=Rhodopirellula europaea 6C TaxID=1263867 RepID=M2ABY8_9BACT|nr:hypothetical protein RE6C_04737 [Rhodopirellula europaea 6C]
MTFIFGRVRAFPFAVSFRETFIARSIFSGARFSCPFHFSPKIRLTSLREFLAVGG